MSRSNPPRVVIFAGPNGAGKSKQVDAILAALGVETFVNADYVARGLSGRKTDMAQTAKTQPSRLTPSPKARQKALEQSAKHATLLAQAFGVTVPTTKIRPVNGLRPADHMTSLRQHVLSLTLFSPRLLGC